MATFLIHFICHLVQTVSCLHEWPAAWSNMARRKDSEAQQNREDSDSNPNDEVEEEPNFEDPEGFVDDISEQGMLVVSLLVHMVTDKLEL